MANTGREPKQYKMSILFVCPGLGRGMQKDIESGTLKLLSYEQIWPFGGAPISLPFPLSLPTSIPFAVKSHLLLLSHWCHNVFSLVRLSIQKWLLSGCRITGLLSRWISEREDSI